MEEIENDKTIPKVDLVDKGNTKVNTEENTVNPVSKMAETKINRRDFLKCLGVSAAALAVGGCVPKNAVGTESEKDNLKDNIQELNKQYLTKKEKQVSSHMIDLKINILNLSNIYHLLIQLHSMLKEIIRLIVMQ